MKNYKKGCILIIGQLRFHLLNKIFFENHKKNFDFFAVVDSNSEEKLNDLSFIKDSFIVEKNLNRKVIPQSIIYSKSQGCKNLIFFSMIFSSF